VFTKTSNKSPLCVYLYVCSPITALFTFTKHPSQWVTVQNAIAQQWPSVCQWVHNNNNNNNNNNNTTTGFPGLTGRAERRQPPGPSAERPALQDTVQWSRALCSGCPGFDLQVTFLLYFPDNAPPGSYSPALQSIVSSQKSLRLHLGTSARSALPGKSGKPYTDVCGKTLRFPASVCEIRHRTLRWQLGTGVV